MTRVDQGGPKTIFAIRSFTTSRDGRRAGPRRPGGPVPAAAAGPSRQGSDSCGAGAPIVPKSFRPLQPSLTSESARTWPTVRQRGSCLADYCNGEAVYCNGETDYCNGEADTDYWCFSATEASIAGSGSEFYRQQNFEGSITMAGGGGGQPSGPADWVRRGRQ